MTLARSSFAPAPNRAFRSRNVVKAPARRTRSSVAVKAEGGFDRLNIVIVGAECAPFSKTGGLGDVVQSLPKVRGPIHLVDILFPLPKHRFFDGPTRTDLALISTPIFIVFAGARASWPPRHVRRPHVPPLRRVPHPLRSPEVQRDGNRGRG